MGMCFHAPMKKPQEILGQLRLRGPSTSRTSKNQEIVITPYLNFSLERGTVDKNKRGKFLSSGDVIEVFSEVAEAKSLIEEAPLEILHSALFGRVFTHTSRFMAQAVQAGLPIRWHANPEENFTLDGQLRIATENPGFSLLPYNQAKATQNGPSVQVQHKLPDDALISIFTQVHGGKVVAQGTVEGFELAELDSLDMRLPKAPVISGIPIQQLVFMADLRMPVKITRGGPQ